MSDQEMEEIKKLLKETLPPVRNAELRTDLWPAMAHALVGLGTACRRERHDFTFSESNSGAAVPPVRRIYVQASLFARISGGNCDSNGSSAGDYDWLHNYPVHLQLPGAD
jgi:hypothetical protein